MALKEILQKIPKERLKGTNAVSSNKDYDLLIMRDFKNIIHHFLKERGISNIEVRPSVGRGNYATIPWVCLLSDNPKISPSPKKGIYVVILFVDNLDSFYLCLGQGITAFKDKFTTREKREEVIKGTVNYFKSEISEVLINDWGFIFDQIDLGKDIGDLGKGYIQTNIISKKYNNNNFDDNDFFNSLEALLEEYKLIINQIGDKSYDDIIDIINPSSRYNELDDALEDINRVISENFIIPRDSILKPVEVKRGSVKVRRYTKLTEKKRYKKVDYIKQAKDNYQIGLFGEKLALEIEKDRILKFDCDPSEVVKWVADETDGLGYDIESVDYIDGELSTIYIEVKTTKDINDTPFYITENEVNVSNEYQNRYRILRIFDINSSSPKYYTASGAVEDNFYLNPTTYLAQYKYEVK